MKKYQHLSSLSSCVTFCAKYKQLDHYLELQRKRLKDSDKKTQRIEKVGKPPDNSNFYII